MKRTTMALIAFPFISATIPYLYAYLMPGPDGLLRALIMVSGTGAAFVVGLLLAVLVYAVVELRAARAGKTVRHNRS